MIIPELIEEVKNCFSLKFVDTPGNLPNYTIACDAYRLGKLLELQRMDNEMEILKDRAARIAATLIKHKEKRKRDMTKLSRRGGF